MASISKPVSVAILFGAGPLLALTTIHIGSGEDEAAHKSLPLGTELAVINAGESVRVTVTDRGPHVAGRGLDLSLAAARGIGLTGNGEAPVRVEVF